MMPGLFYLRKTSSCPPLYATHSHRDRNTGWGTGNRILWRIPICTWWRGSSWCVSQLWRSKISRSSAMVIVKSMRQWRAFKIGFRSCLFCLLNAKIILYANVRRRCRRLRKIWKYFYRTLFVHLWRRVSNKLILIM